MSRPKNRRTVAAQVVVGRQLVAERAERDEHLQVGHEALRERQLVVADDPHDVDRELRVRVVRGRGSPGRPTPVGRAALAAGRSVS